jgi:general stress protein 26
MLDKMKALVTEKDIGVLATVSNNKPHCSLMGDFQRHKEIQKSQGESLGQPLDRHA